MKKCVNKILPENIKAQTGFTGKRFSTCFLKQMIEQSLNTNTM